MKRTYLLAAVSMSLMAAPSFATCSMADPNAEPDAGKPLVDYWIYPEDGGDGKIVKLEEGADAPEGFAFQPAPIAEVMAEDEDADEEGIEAARAKIESLEAQRDAEVEKIKAVQETVDIQEKQIAGLKKELTTEKAKATKLQKQIDADAKTIASQKQEALDLNDELNALRDAKKATETVNEPAKTAEEE